MQATFKKLLNHLRLKKRSQRKSLVFHAGTHKTGTSHFQKCLYENSATLREAGFWYPTYGLGLNTKHNRFAHRLLGINLSQGRKTKLPDIITELEEDPSLCTAILSYEGFSLPHTIRQLSQYQKELSSVDVQVILTFRPHLDLAISLYRELCQHVGYTGKLPRLITAPKHPQEKSWNKLLQYKQIVAAWEEIVPARNIRILPYEKVKKNLLASLLNEIGYQGPELHVDKARVNQTLSAPAAELMRRINSAKIKSNPRHMIALQLYELDKALPELAEYTEITHKQALKLQELFAEDRAFLASHGFEQNHMVMKDEWRWGTNTDINSIMPKAEKAFLELLGQHEDTSLLSLADSALKNFHQQAGEP
jgi:hypothetical protein